MAVGAAALALWSAWNPGYYYLTRAALFTLIGAGATFAWLRDRHRRYAVAASLLYVTLVLNIAIVEEWITVPTNQIESVNILFVPLAALFLAGTAVAALIARFRHHA